MSVRSHLTRLAATGAVAGLLAAAPALAQQAPIVPDGVEVGSFAPIDRAPLPGERATGRFPGIAPGGPAGIGFGFNGMTEEPAQPGASDTGLTVQAFPGNGNIYSRRDTRMSRLMGDGVLVYENPVNSRNYGYNPRTGGYDRWHGSLSYNQSYLRHLYDGNLAGTPSTGAPLEFWRGTR